MLFQKSIHYGMQVTCLLGTLLPHKEGEFGLNPSFWHCEFSTAPHLCSGPPFISLSLLLNYATSSLLLRIQAGLQDLSFLPCLQEIQWKSAFSWVCSFMNDFMRGEGQRRDHLSHDQPSAKPPVLPGVPPALPYPSSCIRSL